MYFFRFFGKGTSWVAIHHRLAKNVSNIYKVNLYEKEGYYWSVDKIYNNINFLIS